MNDKELTSTELGSGLSLAAVYVFRMLGLFMVIPVIAVAAIEYPDYSPLLVGLAIGGYGLTQAILQIPMGIMSDRLGRKPIIYLGLALFALGSLIAGIAESMTVLILGRVLQGAGAIAGAVMALASDVTRESQRTKIMALIGVSIGLSFYLALLLGPLIAANYGVSAIFYLTAASALFCFPLVKFGVPNVQPSSATGDALPKTEYLSALFSHPHLWRLNLLVLVLHLLITSFFVQIPVLLTDIGEPLARHYQVYGVVLLISVAILVVLIRMANVLTTQNMFNITLLLMAVGLVLLTQVPTYWLIVAAGISFFAGFNFLEAKMPAMVSSIAPAGQKGSAMGIYASFQFLGAFVGGMLSGAMNAYFDTKTTFVVCLLFIFLASLVARGLANVERVKRVTLGFSESTGMDDDSINHAMALLMAIEGVKDVSADPEAKAFYLKVDAKLFNTQLALDSLHNTQK
ncbi:MFS transporter [Agaribacter flavus]|uniref:MFS transporter n=1 Tax=Agaribacter flavus TaxID=1902781 RepID=A0ABV7FSX7_9ALTE